MKNIFNFGGQNPFKEAKTENYIQLDQTGADSFTVTYGLQQTTKLRYEQAAKELGECIFHCLASEGLLDNGV